jgi:PAS domain S-box-containing protein
MTKRKQDLIKPPEEKLRESEAKYRAIVEITDTGFVILDYRGRVLDANLEYVRLTGRNELCEILGRCVTEWTAYHDKERNARAVAQCMRDGQIRGLIIDYVGSNGRITPTEINATVQGDGKSLRIITLCRDITERKKAEAALRESEERFRTLFGSSPDPAWIIEENRFVECNQAAIDALGYPDTHALKNTHPSRLSPEFQPDGEASYGKAERMMAIAQDKGFNRFEWVHRRWDQSDFFAEVTLSAILLQGRRILYCIWRDITKRKIAEAALTDEHNLYMDLVKSVPAGVYRLHISRQKPWKKREWVGKVETNYRIEVMSNSFCKLLGASRQNIEANAATVVDCLHPDDRQDFVRRNVVALETMQPFEWEGRVKHPGPTQWVRFLSVPRSMPNGDVIWTGVLLDTTAVNRAVESLQKSREELEDRVRERTARLRSLAAQLTRAEHAERRRIAHLLHEDLQQRLAAIKYKVHELKDSVQAGSALRAADRTIRELTEAIELTRDLTTRLAPPVLYLFGLRPALDILTKEMEAHSSLSVQITGLQTFRLPSDEIAHFAFDAVRELLLNVTKYAGVTSAEIRIRPAGKKRIAVEVRDKGKGIARNNRQTDRFGLFSIRERAEAMGIGFDISSRPGQGTCVALSLPVL